ncbi:DUF2750 domain-containing protein [Alteromonas sp. C1M14]|uniref:DUF2750 domain-containing protein n=1 Tax=Alteromonas sp. C1M14 TaxID=2841567 RepID=UPI001C098391|nr:DUF2750 domain-containing protein [Alteromonas sp. C1M14]MBU2977159.1 DUF2750 domain-containing protein [Alteromonas sp. C1M14]
MSSLPPLLDVNADERMHATINSMVDLKEVWILKDDDGCVMLTSDDEDGVPIWPDETLAKLWATDEWSHCQTMRITLDDWLGKWTPGLMKDELMIMVCPVPAEEGEVITPEYLAERLLARKG